MAFVILGTALSVAVLPRVARVLPVGDETTPREIRINVRDMTYYVEGSSQPNPTLRLEPGRRVRVVLNNNDAGMSHDMQVPAWGVGTRLLKGKGSATIDFTVPNLRGTYPYKCTPHSEMMQGIIEVK
jgi:plastocyanin